MLILQPLFSPPTFYAIERIGMPEARILLSQCTVYLASSLRVMPRTWQSTKSAIRNSDLQVPLHLRNAPTQLMSNRHGDGYQYDHDSSGGFSSKNLPDSLSGNTLYTPGINPREKSMREYLKAVWKNKYGY